MPEQGSVAVTAYKATYGKPVQFDDGPVVQGQEHGLTSWSHGLPSELGEVCRPRVLIPVDVNPLRLVDQSFHERGALIIVPVLTVGWPSAWVIAGRMRPYKEDGKRADGSEGTGRPMTLMHNWCISAKDWSQCAPEILNYIGANLAVKPDLQTAIVGERRVQPPETFFCTTRAPDLPVDTLLQLRGVWGILDGIYDDKPTEWSRHTFPDEKAFLLAMACVFALLPSRDPASPSALIPFCSGLTQAREHFLVSYLESDVVTESERRAPSERFSAGLDSRLLLSEVPKLRSTEAGLDPSLAQVAVGHIGSDIWVRELGPEIRSCIEECYFPRRKPQVRPIETDRRPTADRVEGSPATSVGSGGSPAVSGSTSPPQPVQVAVAPARPELSTAAQKLADFVVSRSNVNPRDAASCIRYVYDRNEWSSDPRWEGELLDIKRQFGPYIESLIRTLRRLMGNHASRPEFFPLADLNSTQALCDLANEHNDPHIKSTVERLGRTAALRTSAFYQHAGILDQTEIQLTETEPRLKEAFRGQVELAVRNGQLLPSRSMLSNPIAHWAVLLELTSPSHPEGSEADRWRPSPTAVHAALAAIINRCKTMTSVEPRMDAVQINQALRFLAIHEPERLRNLDERLPSPSGHGLLALMRGGIESLRS